MTDIFDEVSEQTEGGDIPEAFPADFAGFDQSPQTIDVEMPDGTLVQGAPEGITQSELGRRYNLYGGADTIDGQMTDDAIPQTLPADFTDFDELPFDEVLARTIEFFSTSPYSPLRPGKEAGVPYVQGRRFF